MQLIPVRSTLIAVVCSAAMFHAVALPAAAQDSSGQLAGLLRNVLPRMGHRNWIVVADMAYPAQSAPGIKTVYLGGNHLEAIKTTLKAIDQAPHVRAEVMLDQELAAVAEADAPGIDKFRRQLAEALGPRHFEQRPHEQIIQDLAEASKTFEVLIVKTDMTLPYTSVFLRLDCGYWSGEAEERLRQSLSTE